MEAPKAGTLRESKADLNLESALSRSREVLNAIDVAGLPAKPCLASDALQMEEASDLLQPGPGKMEHGYTRMPDGKLFIAVLTPLENITGEMFDWWFRYVDNTEKYKLWHPRDHVEGYWSEPHGAKPLEDRLPGHVVGCRHIVKEYLGKELQELEIEFKDPSEYLDSSKFEEAGVTACVVARVSAKDGVAGMVKVGHMLHMVRRTEGGGSELRSRFWLGDIHKETGGFPPRWLVNFVGNTRAGRRVKGPLSVARNLLRHCYEEMTCLDALLPEIWWAHHPQQAGGGKA